MNNTSNTLEIRFDGAISDRQEFIKRIRCAVVPFTGESMSLDALLIEIAKNIFDHAHGLGSLVIVSKAGSFEFVIQDEGDAAFDYEHCSKNSTRAGNGVNYGIGLGIIKDIAETLGIELMIDTSKGFSYSGVYTPKQTAK